MSIRIKLTIIFLAIALIPLLFVSFLTFDIYKDSLKTERLSHLWDLATFRADKIETYFVGLKTYIEMLQNSYVIKKNFPVLARLADDPANPEYINAKKTLDEILEKTSSVLSLSNIILVNPEGRIIYAYNPKHYQKKFLASISGVKQKAFKEGKDKIYFSDIFLSEEDDNKPAILVTAPVFDIGGVSVGVVAFETAMTPIYNFIRDATGLGNTGEILLGRKTGDQVEFLSPLKFDPNAALNRKVSIGESVGGPIQKAAQSVNGTGELIDYRGKKVIAAWRYIPFLNWGMVAKIDTEEAFSDVVRLKNLVFIILGIIFILGGIMAFSIAQSIARPIKKLSKGVDIVGRGNLDYKLAINSQDEIGHLSRAFDKMTAEQKCAQKSLRLAAQYTRNLIETSLDPLVTISNEGKITDVNEATMKATGLSRDKLIGTDFSSYFTEPEKARAGYQQVFDRGFVTGYPLTIRHKDGRLMDVLYNASVYKDTRGNTTGIFAAARDVTIQKQAEAELRRHKDNLELMVKERTAQLKESEEDLKRAQTVARIGSWRLDMRENKLNWSDEVYRMFGILKGTLMTYEAFLARIHPDDLELVDKAWKAALAGEPYDIEHRILVENDVKWLREQAELEFDKEGVLLGGFGTVQDITERKTSEQLLQKAHDELEEKVLFRTRDLNTTNKQLSQEILRRKETERELSARNILLKLLNRAASRKDYIEGAVKLIKNWSKCQCVGIKILDEEGKISYESHIGFDSEFLRSENCLSIETDHCVCIRVIKGEPESAEKPFMSESGSFCCNDSQAFLKKLTREDETKFRGVCIKSGFQTLAVIPIRYMDKIVGAIHLVDKEPDKIGGVSREFIEALSGIVAEAINKFNLEDKIKKEHAMLDSAHKELEQVRRLSDIGTLAATVAHELRNPLAAIRMASYNIRRKAQNPLLDKHLVTIEKKVNESDQIINNLLFYSRLKLPQYESINICEIIEECVAIAKDRYQKNKISIEVTLKPLENISVEADPLQIIEVFSNIVGNAYEAIIDGQGAIGIDGSLDNSFVKISVKDNGVGISPEDVQKVFDPFFTTKAKGTGLGLTVCKQIIGLHGGIIDIMSRKNNGSTVIIKLPMHRET